ncbi:MAG: hypothetical protein ACP5M4_07010 [Acidobacteriaceae bacterium]
MAKRYLLLILLLIITGRAFADGGRLRFRKPAGPFTVTLFTTPDPLTRGRADFSVAIERANSTGLVENAQVTYILTNENNPTQRITLHASRSQATSRFLQAADFTLPNAGLWRIDVLVKEGNQFGQCSGQFRVRKQDLATSERAWQIALVPIMVLLFFLHQWRKREYVRRKATRLAATQST